MAKDSIKNNEIIINKTDEIKAASKLLSFRKNN